jgi:hypothetical protein
MVDLIYLKVLCQQDRLMFDPLPEITLPTLNLGEPLPVFRTEGTLYMEVFVIFLIRWDDLEVHKILNMSICVDQIT